MPAAAAAAAVADAGRRGGPHHGVAGDAAAVVRRADAADGGARLPRAPHEVGLVLRHCRCTYGGNWWKQLEEVLMARNVLGGQENLARRLRVSLAGVSDRSNWRLDLPPTVG